jgi:hypothetical protein
MALEETDMTTLDERRKGDRDKMATAILGDWIAAPGFTAEREDNWPGDNPRCVMLKLSAPNGLRLNLDFNGSSWQPNVYVLSWYIDIGHAKCLAPIFGSVNEYHRQKATDIVEGFQALRDLLSRRITEIQRGDAFL